MDRKSDRRSLDYNARERRTSTFNIVICVLFLVILIGVDIGMVLLEQPQKEIVLGIICTVIFAVITGLIIRYHVKRFVLPNINDSEADPAKKAMYSRKDGEDMFEVLERSRKRVIRNMILIMAVLAVLIALVLWLSPSMTVFRITIPGPVMAVLYVLMFIGIGLIAYKESRKYKSADDLRKELYIKGFDPDKVNRDFMRGSTHRLPGGFLVIGQDYYVVYIKDLVHVCAVRDVLAVNGVSSVDNIKNIEGSGYRWHLVHVHEKDQSFSFSCSNKLSIDTIVDEFRKKGIETSYKILEKED